MKKFIYGLEAKLLKKIRKYDNKCIVMVSDSMKPRVAKIGYALRKKGYHVIFLMQKSEKNRIGNAEVPFFDKLCYFDNGIDAYMKCLRFAPLVYHIFSEANIGEWVEYLIKKKNDLGKIVYDQYDVYRGLSSIFIRDCVEREKYCMENADGLCCRNFETQFLKHKYNYKFNGERILFLDYCWNNHSVKRKKRNINQPLRIVYGGRILPNKAKMVLGKTEWEAIEFLAQKLNESDNDFYMIPSGECDKRLYRDFYKLDESLVHFKLKKTMPYKRLIHFESRMDYGIDCLEFQNKADEYKKYYRLTDYEAKARYYATNKFFDYLDAGIPIIYGRKGEMFGRYLSAYGVAVPCELENMPNEFNNLKSRRDEYAKNVIVAREKLAVENQIERLILFYKQL